ncbi:MAG: DUF4340 domain-containing protein [Deltaproteobacteria bacterium]|nr:DUF4340 domain-containing protein [Deltaproteobacteria bacterium]
MGFRRSTILILLVAAAAGAALCALAPGKAAEPEALRLLPENVDVVGLEVRFEAPMRLELQERRARGDDWRIAGAVDWPADPGIVDAMITALDVARPERAVEVGPSSSLARYGLAPPADGVSIVLSDKRTIVVSFGTSAPGERRVYAWTSLHPDVVLVVDEALRSSVDRSPAELRDRRLWVLDPEAMVSVEVADARGAVLVERIGRRFRVTPPGVAADFERASRLFELLAVPRAAGFPDGDACAAEEGFRIRIADENGVGHELRMSPCDPCPADAVRACLDGRDVVAVPADLGASARELSADLARTSLLPAIDPPSVTSIAVTSSSERWTLHRTPDGWRSDDGALSPETDVVLRWLRPLALLQVDPARLDAEPFVVAGTIELASRLGSTIRLERSSEARDGSVRVRREGEEAAFRLAPAEAALLTAARTYLSASAGAACDPLAVQTVEVLSGAERAPAAGVVADAPPVVQRLRRAPAGRWMLEGTTLRVDAAAVDLLVGDLCRLPGRPLVPRAALEPDVRWTVVLGAADDRQLLRLEVFAPAGDEDTYAAAGYGAPERHALPSPAVDRLGRALVAPDALDADPGQVARWEIDLEGGRTIRLYRDGGDWRVDDGSTGGGTGDAAASADAAAPDSGRISAAGAADLARALAAPRLLGVVSLEAPDDPSADWPHRFVVRRVAADGSTSSFAVGGPDAGGRVLLWSEEFGAVLEAQAEIHAALVYLDSLESP